MKTKSKALLLSLCVILLAAASVFGTLAYLTDTAAVTNTFTVGKVGLTLDEASVNSDGTPIEGADRVQANTYKLMPGHTYTKDPVVHFKPESEASFLFVKVENGIADIESTENGYTNIAAQITGNGWTALGNNYPNVYYKGVAANTSKTEDVNYPVFASFKVSGDVVGGTKPADAGADDTNLYLGDYAGKTITVTAYAVQADGFTTAEAAWIATFGAPATAND